MRSQNSLSGQKKKKLAKTRKCNLKRVILLKSPGKARYKEKTNIKIQEHLHPLNLSFAGQSYYRPGQVYQYAWT